MHFNRKCASTFCASDTIYWIAGSEPGVPVLSWWRLRKRWRRGKLAILTTDCEMSRWLHKTRGYSLIWESRWHKQPLWESWHKFHLSCATGILSDSWLLLYDHLCHQKAQMWEYPWDSCNLQYITLSVILTENGESHSSIIIRAQWVTDCGS